MAGPPLKAEIQEWVEGPVHQIGGDHRQQGQQQMPQDAAGCAAGCGTDTFAPQFSQNLVPGFNSAPHCVHVAIVSASFTR